MHICFITGEYPPSLHGGIGSFIKTLAKSLVNNSHQVSVIGVYKQSMLTIEDDHGVQVIRVPWSRIPKIGVLIDHYHLNNQIDFLNKRMPIDLIEGQENAFTYLPGTKNWKKLIRMHGGHHFFASELGKPYHPYKKWAEEKSFRNADLFCAVSNYVKESTQKLINNKIAVEVIPNPVDTELFQPKPEIPIEDGLIVFVGTLCEKKGIRQLILAMPEIINKIEHAHLWAIGRDQTDPLSGKSFKQILIENMKPEIQDRISFLGVRDHAQIPDLLARANICIYPSHMEAHPIVVLEGMAAGKAVITSLCGPGPETVQHSVNGLLCDPHQPKSIADEVIRLFLDPDLRDKLGKAARKTVVEKYALDVLVQKNINFYQKCLNSKNY